MAKKPRSIQIWPGPAAVLSIGDKVTLRWRDGTVETATVIAAK